MAITRCNVSINNIQKEMKVHGSPSFPIGLYYDYLPTDDVPWHWHEHLELGYVEKGTVHLGVNSDKKIIHEGKAYFINKEILHSFWCENEDTCTIHSMVFKSELLGSHDSVFYQNYIQPLVDNNELPYITITGNEEWHKEILNLFSSAWLSATNEEFGFEFNIRNRISRILLLIIRYMSKQSNDFSEKALRTERRTKVMLTYISENYANEIRVKDIANSAMISESECLRCFHDSVGISPIKYIRQLRIQTAAELLISTDRPINDIAEQCGFQDRSYFTKSFRENKGSAPSEFRMLF